MLSSVLTRDCVTVYKDCSPQKKLFEEKENVFFLFFFFSPQIFVQSVNQLETPNLFVLILVSFEWTTLL